MKKKFFTIVASLSLLSLPAMSFALTANGSLHATAKVTAKCVVKSTTNVAFEAVDPTTNANYDGAGTVITQCTKNTLGFLFVTPTAGTELTMLSPTTGDTITYALYSDAGRTVTFPSATGAKTTQPGTPQTTNIYGRVVVASGQNDTIAAAEDYTQALTATIEW
ncbi:MAG: spore coat protein U domain-containing protein [Desulfuromonadaceae bacterium]